jgi:nitrogen fixation/metabolism regulation signal transduction histidine kinase
MQSDFRGRLFRLFLLFSIIPALLLTAFAVIAVSDLGSAFLGEEPEGEAVDFLNTVMFERLEGALSGDMDPAEGNQFLDFAFASDDDAIQTLLDGVVTPPDVLARLREAASQRNRGFVDINGEIYQFVSSDSADRLTVAGIRLGGEYSRIMSEVQRDRAERVGEAALRPRYGYFLIALFCCLTVLTVVLAFYFSRRMAGNLSRPLHDLSDAAHAVADGDFQTRVEPSGDSDIRQLIESFNQMVEDLQSTTARLAATERVAAWRQVARRFAHELKNPLQPILVSLYRIERLVIDTPAYDDIYEPLKATSDEVRHLKDLAERFSHLAKLPPPQFSETDLVVLLKRIVALYGRPDEPAPIELQVPPKPSCVRIDANYLREAVHNLVQNALDAGGSESIVRISIEENDATYAIVIQDDGPGMDAETLGAARLPYFTTKHDGQGLGLAIVEKSVAELNGRLEIVSHPGQGTTATIILAKDVA